PDRGHRLQSPPDPQTHGREVVRIGKADHDPTHDRHSDERPRQADRHGPRIDDPLNPTLDKRTPAARWAAIARSHPSREVRQGVPTPSPTDVDPKATSPVPRAFKYWERWERDLTLRSPGYEPPRACMRVPPYSAQVRRLRERRRLTGRYLRESVMG